MYILKSFLNIKLIIRIFNKYKVIIFKYLNKIVI